MKGKKITAKERVEQFKDEFYEDSGVLFCKFCEHCLDFSRIDTLKDHLKSQKHALRKQSKLAKAEGSSRQVTLSTLVKAKDMRQDFCLDFIKMCSVADVPLEKVEKMRPFLNKHCSQAGALPKVDQLRTTYVPRLFSMHFESLKQLLSGKKVSITADETTDIRDQSILNVIATVHGQAYLIGVKKMGACNHSTFSQAIIQAVTSAQIRFEDVMAIVSDSAAYCKKAYREVLSAVFAQSTHILCLAHIVNLAAEIFHHFPDFKHTSDLITMIKSSLFKKPGRKSRFLTYLGDYIPSSEVKLPPSPVSSRWNSWFEAAIYHATRVHLYEGFYKAERGTGMAVQRILELVTHKEIYPEILLQLYFLKENCQRLIMVLTSLEENKSPLACKVFNLLEDLKAYLRSGQEKVTFGPETDRLLSKLPEADRKKQVKSFQKVFTLSLKKLEDHLDKHPAWSYYKAVRVFDPRQLPILEHDIAHYEVISGLKSPTAELHEEWLIYMQLQPNFIPTPFSLPSFWECMRDRFPLLTVVALDAMWMPVSSVDVERSFSIYKHLLDDRREGLSEENTERLVMLYYNGDIEGRFD